MNSCSTGHLATSELVDLSLQAVANQENYGSVAQLSRQYNVHRRVVYAIRASAFACLAKAFSTPKASTTVNVTAGHVARCVIVLYMVGRCSIWSIVGMLPILLPGVKGCGFGTVQRLLVEAALKAQLFNSRMDLGGVKAIALDEMFSQGDPVLATIDLDTSLIVQLERRDQRTTEDWRQVLTSCKHQGLNPDVAVRDGGAAIAAGLAAVFPDVEQRDDNLHAQMGVTKVMRKVENRAYTLISRIDKTKRHLAKAEDQANSRPLRVAKLKADLLKATKHCDRLMTEHEELTRLWHRLRAALELVDVANNKLRDSREMQQELGAVATTLSSSKRGDSRKAGHYIKRRLKGLTSHADSVHAELEPLAEEFGQEAVVSAMVVLHLTERMKRWRTSSAKRERLAQLKAALAALKATGRDDEVPAAVHPVFYRRHRASSAIESMNAALRPHLIIRKRVTDGFLHLFQAYSNLRVRRWGRFKSTSAWGLLMGQPAGDWLTHLGYPPAH